MYKIIIPVIPSLYQNQASVKCSEHKKVFLGWVYSFHLMPVIHAFLDHFPFRCKKMFFFLGAIYARIITMIGCNPINNVLKKNVTSIKFFFPPNKKPQKSLSVEAN